MKKLLSWTLAIAMTASMLTTVSTASAAAGETLLSENFSTFSATDVVKNDTDDYINGKKWGTLETDKVGNAFKYNQTSKTLEVYGPPEGANAKTHLGDQTNNEVSSLLKKFPTATEGNGLEVAFDVKLDNANIVAVDVALDDGTNQIVLFDRRYASWGNGYVLKTQGQSVNMNAYGVTDGNEITTFNGFNDPKYTYHVRAKLLPKGNDTAVQVYIPEFGYNKTETIANCKVSDLNTFAIHTGRFKNEGEQTKALEIGNLKITEIAPADASVQLWKESFDSDILTGSDWTSIKTDETKSLEDFSIANGKLNIGCGHTKGTAQGISRNFEALQAGEGLKVTADVQLVGNSNLTSVAVGLGKASSDKNVNMLYFTNTWGGSDLSAFGTLQAHPYIYSTEQGAVAFTSADGKEDHTESLALSYWRIDTSENGLARETAHLAGNIKLTFTMEPNNDGTYNCTSYIESAQAAYKAEKVLTAEEAAGLNRIDITENEDFEGDVDILTIDNLTVSKTTVAAHEPKARTYFGEILLDKPEVILDENMSRVKLDQIVADNHAIASYENGTAWGTGDYGAMETMFKNDGAFRVNNPTVNYTSSYVKKKFTMPQGDDSLILKADLDLKYVYGSDFSIRLGTNEGKEMTVFRHSGIMYRGFMASAFETSPNANPYVGFTETEVSTNVYSYTYNNGLTPLKKVGDENTTLGVGYWQDNCGLKDGVTVTFEMTPADNDNYNVSVLVEGDNVSYAANSTVAADLAKSFTTVAIHEGRCEGENGGESAVVHSIKLESFKNTALAAGENKLYIPYVNTTGEEQPMKIISAVCGTNDDSQKSYAIADNAANVTDGYLEVTANVTDAANEYVKVFLFDSFTNLKPYTKAKVIGK